MKTVKIVKQFILQHNDKARTRELIRPGEHQFEDDVADHWWVRAHSDNPPKAEPKRGTPEYAFAQARAAAEEQQLHTAVERAAEDAKVEARDKARRRRPVAEAPAAVEEPAEAAQPEA